MPSARIRLRRNRYRWWQNVVAGAPAGYRVWERYNDYMQKEPVHERDRMMTAMLAPLGLEKGKPFAPAEREKKLIADGAFMSMNISYTKRCPDWSYCKDAKWAYVILLVPKQETLNYSQLDERTDYFYEAVTMVPGRSADDPSRSAQLLLCLNWPTAMCYQRSEDRVSTEVDQPLRDLVRRKQLRDLPQLKSLVVFSTRTDAHHGACQEVRLKIV